MKFLVRLLLFFGVNIVLVLLMIGINPWQYPSPITVAMAISVIATVLISCLLYKTGERRIWYFPLSQVALCFVVCAYLLARNWFGFRHGGGWIDFGVKFEVMFIILLAGLWVVPSLVAAFIYALIMKKQWVEE